jgi:hypothetical protein
LPSVTSASFASSRRFSNRAIACSTSRRVADDLAAARARTPPADRVVERLAVPAVERLAVRGVERLPARAVDFFVVDLRAGGIASPVGSRRVVVVLD